MFTVAIADIDNSYVDGSCLEDIRCYGIFTTEEKAENYLNKIKEEYSRWYKYNLRNACVTRINENYPGVLNNAC